MLPWSERVAMLGVHPDVGTRDDIARLSAELMQRNKRIKELEAKNTKLQEANGHYLEVCSERQNLNKRIEELETAVGEWRDKADSELAINAELHTETAHKTEQIKELEYNNALLEKRRGGECKKCGSWVCPPLTCFSCLVGEDMKSELRKTNEKLTLRIEELEAEIQEVANQLLTLYTDCCDTV